ncbi:sensor histidine kinase [Brachybacterium sp. J153]|uniref:sensor histidine kinase n=1 Tax=Brachybacterium sp. J153 TaxID=3116488 RepID=UPI002E76434C|nr:sensor histidine kinase [Brachybacterium sp. J153]MEE1617721.1 sensor histidine kinase [Brachybacterium sp. J153]
MSETMSGPSAAPPPAGRRRRRLPPRAVDLLLAVLVALALTLVILTNDRGARPADALAILFAAGFGALLLLRRSMPRTVLVLSVLAMFAYYTRDYPPIGVAVPILAALFSAAEAGRWRWAVGAAAVSLLVSTAFRLLEGGESIGVVLGYESVTNVALFAAAIALGDGLRTRRLRERQQAEIARLTAAQLAREADLRIQSERERISRDLHDTVGHTLSVISLHAGAGGEAVGARDEEAREAFARIRDAAGRSLRELRVMVRLLRSPEGHSGGGVPSDGGPAPEQVSAGRGPQSLVALPELAAEAGAAGLAVALDVEVEPADLPGPVDTAAFRVVQESLTNVLRHAGTDRATVRAQIRDGRLHLRIADDGAGRSAADGGTPAAGDSAPVADEGATASGGQAPTSGGPTSGGHGLVGMTERVRLLGGTLTAGPSPDGGFVVEASLPTRLQ